MLHRELCCSYHTGSTKARRTIMRLLMTHFFHLKVFSTRIVYLSGGNQRASTHVVCMYRCTPGRKGFQRYPLCSACVRWSAEPCLSADFLQAWLKSVLEVSLLQLVQDIIDSHVYMNIQIQDRVHTDMVCIFSLHVFGEDACN